MATFFAAFGRLFTFARRAVREGVGVTASRNALREGGFHFSNAAYSQVHAVATRLDTVQRLERVTNLAARPGASRIVRGPWGFTERWAQVVRFDMRDIETGVIRSWDVMLTRDRLTTRMEAIDEALERTLPSLDEYGQELVDVTYSHTLGRV